MSNICMVDFRDTTLLVRLMDLTINTDGTWPPGYGCFTVGMDINHYEDVKSCMRTCRDTTQKLHHQDGVSEIVITAVQFANGFCFCNFSVLKMDVSQNTIIWDASGNRKLSFADVEEMVGGDVDGLATQAVQLIEKHKYFTPSAKFPVPSSMPGGSYADDVAAVIALAKPAAVFSDYGLSEDRLLVFLCGEAVMRGFAVETAQNFATAHTKQRSVVLGEQYAVWQIVEIMDQAVRTNSVGEHYYRRLGNLLGHGTLTEVKDFGFNDMRNR